MTPPVEAKQLYLTVKKAPVSSEVTDVVTTGLPAQEDVKEPNIESPYTVRKPDITHIFRAIVEIQRKKSVIEKTKVNKIIPDVGKTIKSPDNELCLQTHYGCTGNPRGVCVSVKPCSSHFCNSCGSGF